MENRGETNRQPLPFPIPSPFPFFPPFAFLPFPLSSSFPLVFCPLSFPLLPFSLCTLVRSANADRRQRVPRHPLKTVKPYPVKGKVCRMKTRGTPVPPDSKGASKLVSVVLWGNVWLLASQKRGNDRGGLFPPSAPNRASTLCRFVIVNRLPSLFRVQSGRGQLSGERSYQRDQLVNLSLQRVTLPAQFLIVCAQNLGAERLRHRECARIWRSFRCSECSQFSSGFRIGLDSQYLQTPQRVRLAGRRGRECGEIR
jgi:hypothetical protein